jgi:hypothetical protein
MGLEIELFWRRWLARMALCYRWDFMGQGWMDAWLAGLEGCLPSMTGCLPASVSGCACLLVWSQGQKKGCWLAGWMDGWVRGFLGGTVHYSYFSFLWFRVGNTSW